jgi:Protein of unknown function (DUF2971)
VTISRYVACFSSEEAKDSLPMWYMYAAHGTGVCLGFDGRKLIEAHQKFYNDKAFQNHFTLPVFTGLKQHYPNGGRPEELNEAEYHALHNRCSSVH